MRLAGGEQPVPPLAFLPFLSYPSGGGRCGSPEGNGRRRRWPSSPFFLTRAAAADVASRRGTAGAAASLPPLSFSHPCTLCAPHRVAAGSGGGHGGRRRRWGKTPPVKIRSAPLTTFSLSHSTCTSRPTEMVAQAARGSTIGRRPVVAAPPRGSSPARALDQVRARLRREASRWCPECSPGKA